MAATWGHIVSHRALRRYQKVQDGEKKRRGNFAAAAEFHQPPSVFPEDVSVVKDGH